MNQVASPISDKVKVLMRELQAGPQVECNEKHYFGPGLYIKEVTMPAGVTVVGKEHKAEHMCVMLQGRMLVLTGDGEMKEVVAPTTFVAPPGRKVAHILETVVFQNIFATEETNIEKLENMLVYPENNLLEGN